MDVLNKRSFEDSKKEYKELVTNLKNIAKFKPDLPKEEEYYNNIGFYLILGYSDGLESIYRDEYDNNIEYSKLYEKLRELNILDTPDLLKKVTLYYPSYLSDKNKSSY